MKYGWELVSDQSLLSCLKMLDKTVANPPFSDISELTCLAAPLPFYANARFVRIKDPAYPNFERRALIHSNMSALLNKDSAPIHLFNEIVPLSLTPATALSYFHFYFDHVFGQMGRFIILDKTSRPFESLAPGLHESLLTAPRCIGFEPNGSCNITAVICFAQQIIRIEAQIDVKGKISMPSDKSTVIYQSTGLPLDIYAANQPIPKQLFYAEPN
jgi:hypothetical protein